MLDFLYNISDESSRRPTSEDHSGLQKRKGSGSKDEKHFSVEIRINSPNAKRLSGSTRQPANTLNINTNTSYRKKRFDSNLKSSKMRDGEEKASKLASPRGDSRDVSPEQRRSKYENKDFLFSFSGISRYEFKIRQYILLTGCILRFLHYIFRGQISS